MSWWILWSWSKPWVVLGGTIVARNELVFLCMQLCTHTHTHAKPIIVFGRYIPAHLSQQRRRRRSWRGGRTPSRFRRLRQGREQTGRSVSWKTRFDRVFPTWWVLGGTIHDFGLWPVATRFILACRVQIKLELDELKDIMTEFGVSMPDDEVREMFAEVRDILFSVCRMHHHEESNQRDQTWCPGGYRSFGRNKFWRIQETDAE